MRILHAVHGYPPELVGGTELYVRRLAAEQKRRGHEVEVAAGSAGAPEAGEVVERDGIRVHGVAPSTLFHRRWDLTASARVDAWFERLLAASRPDVVHVHHWLRLGRGLARRAAAAGATCVITAHDLFATCPRLFRVRDDEAFCERPLAVESCLHCAPREPWMDDELVALRLRQFAADLSAELCAAAVVIAPSRAHARLLSRFGDLAESGIEIVPHGALVDASLRADGQNRPPRSGAPLRLAHWGRLEPIKGAHVLLEAVAGLPRPADVEVSLWGPASGDKAYRRRLRALGRGLLVRRRETYETSDLRQLEADVAVFPSLAHESHSFVLDEAFALGLPVFVSARGALAERAGRAGADFPPGDSAALTRLLSRALAEPGFLPALAAQVPPLLAFADHCDLLDRVYERGRRRADAGGGRTCDPASPS